MKKLQKEIYKKVLEFFTKKLQNNLRTTTSCGIE
jgi:hypothetical protein